MSHDAAANDRQYGNSRKLAARARLHQLYSHEDVPWPHWVAAKAALRSGERVLDIGCGAGWFWGAAADTLPGGLDITLADLSSGMVEEATDRVHAIGRFRVEGIVADIAALPFADESFNAVIAMHMLYHVPDQERAVAEMARVLKPGGRAIVTTNGLDNLRELYALSAMAFGVTARDPAAELFGFDHARTLLGDAFGNVSFAPHPSRLRITDADDVFAALTSYPPGEDAPHEQLAALRAAIADVFSRGNGVLEVAKDIAVFVSRKPD